MSGFNIELQGLKELQSDLEKRFGNEHNEEVLQAGAEYFKEQLEESVYSYGLKERSGKSEESMKIVVPTNKDEIHIGVSNQSNDAFYLYFHEYGTSKMRARPFMRPTFEKEQQQIIKKMAEAMKVRLRL